MTATNLGAYPTIFSINEGIELPTGTLLADGGGDIDCSGAIHDCSVSWMHLKRKK